MKLYEEVQGVINHTPILPDFFFVQSSSYNVINNLVVFNGNYGQRPISSKGNITVRTFNITGNAEVDDINNLEKYRSFIFASMYGKTLWLRVNDDENIAYKVLLDGAVNISYNVGYEISRVFSFSFTLKAYEGVCWSWTPIQHKFNLNINKGEQIININYLGDVPCMPKIYISLEANEGESQSSSNFTKYDFIIKASRQSFAFIQCENRGLWFFKDAHIEQVSEAYPFAIIDGIPCKSKRILSNNVSSELTYKPIKEIEKDCLALPIILTKGANKININTNLVQYDKSKISTGKSPYINGIIEYRECWY